MSHSDDDDKLGNLRDADPMALAAIIDYMANHLCPVPEIHGLEQCKSLMAPETALQFAYQTGRASVVKDLRIALMAIEEEQGG